MTTMVRRIALGLCLCVCALSLACPSGPSSSSADREAADREAAALERKAEFIEGLLVRRSAAADVLDSLMSALPDRVRLTEALYSPERVEARGTAPTNYALSDYLSRLAGIRSLSGANLRGSSQRTARGGEWVEFLIDANPSASAAEPAGAGVAPAARLAELEKALAPRQDDAAMLRELQILALDAGLQMTRFAPGLATMGEFASELPVTIEVAGDIGDLADYLRGLAGLVSLWVVERLSFKAVSADDPRAGVRASVAARAYFAL
jgi:Tfp pilus assembly protein PilN